MPANSCTQATHSYTHNAHTRSHALCTTVRRAETSLWDDSKRDNEELASALKRIVLTCTASSISDAHLPLERHQAMALLHLTKRPQVYRLLAQANVYASLPASALLVFIHFLPASMRSTQLRAPIAQIALAYIVCSSSLI